MILIEVVYLQISLSLSLSEEPYLNTSLHIYPITLSKYISSYISDTSLHIYPIIVSRPISSETWLDFLNTEPSDFANR